MTFGELTKQVTREVDEGLTREQVTKVILTMWRIILEELIINPQDAKIMIHGLGKIYLQKKRFNCGLYEKKQDTRWIFRFKQSEQLKSVINGRKDLTDMEIGFKPLYFERLQVKKPTYAQLAEGERKYAEMKRRNIKYNRAEVRAEKEKAKKNDIASRLPED